MSVTKDREEKYQNTMLEQEETKEKIRRYKNRGFTYEMISILLNIPESSVRIKE